MSNNVVIVLLAVMQIPIGLISNLTANYLQDFLATKPKFAQTTPPKKFLLSLGVFVVLNAISIPLLLLSSSSDTMGSEEHEALLASPYLNAYIRLDRVDPSETTTVIDGSEVTVYYTVTYFIPNFDWQKIGYRPIIRVSTEGMLDNGNSTLFYLDEINAVIGEETTVTLGGVDRVSNDWNSREPESWETMVQIVFVNVITESSIHVGEHTVRVNYPVERQP